MALLNGNTNLHTGNTMSPQQDENGEETREYRDRLRTWLIKKINSNTIPGLTWENEEKTIFRMPWKHAGRQDYSLEEDSKIFMAWAKHSGRYRAGIDKPEPIVWKTRLRCALNKMPDIRELPERSRLDISEPYRVYQFLPPVHKDSQIRRRTQRRRSQNSNPSPPLNTEGSGPNGDSRMLALTYTNGQNPFSEPSRFQHPKLRAANMLHAISHSQPGKPNPMLPWINNAYVPNTETQAFSDKISPQITSPGRANIHPNPFAEFINARRLEGSIQPDGERVFPNPNAIKQPPTDFFNFRPTSSNFHGFPTPQHHEFINNNQVTSPPIAPIPPMMMSAAGQGLAAFALRHQLGMTCNPATFMSHVTAQALAMEQKYQEAVNFQNKLEDENDRLRRGEKKLQREIRRLQCHDIKSEENTNDDAKPSHAAQKESDPTIEKLKLELEQYRRAHEKEKKEREKLEKERESMKSTLEQMGEGLRSLASNAPEVLAAPQRDQLSPTETIKPRSSPNGIWNPLTSTCSSPNSKRRLSDETSHSTKRPRFSPPLDLTVANTTTQKITETTYPFFDSNCSENATRVTGNNTLSPSSSKSIVYPTKATSDICTTSYENESEHIDIESPVAASSLSNPPTFDVRPHPMTSPGSVSSCNSSAESITSPKSPQHILRLFGNNQASNPNPFQRYSQSLTTNNGAIHVS